MVVMRKVYSLTGLRSSSPAPRSLSLADPPCRRGHKRIRTKTTLRHPTPVRDQPKTNKKPSGRWWRCRRCPRLGAHRIAHSRPRWPRPTTYRAPEDEPAQPRSGGSAGNGEWMLFG